MTSTLHGVNHFPFALPIKSAWSTGVEDQSVTGLGVVSGVITTWYLLIPARYDRMEPESFFTKEKKKEKKSKGINDEIGVVMYVPVCDE